MSLLVSDTSVIIDLDRGGLLEAAFGIGDELVVPDILFARELDGGLGRRLLDLGLRVEALDGEEVAKATRIGRAERRLSVADSFAFALASKRRWTLLTGDAALRALAEADGLEVHGMLWVVDRLELDGICDHPTLHAGLSKTAAHPRCRLPRREVEHRLRRYREG